MPALLAALMTVAQIAPVQDPASAVHALAVRAPKARLHLEIADNQAARERGLMFRTKLAPHTGMVFVFQRDDAVTFWMKNTIISLDMVFLGADGRVRTVSANVPATFSDTPEAQIARRTARARYVLELPAGEAARDGIKPGARLGALTALH